MGGQRYGEGQMSDDVVTMRPTLAVDNKTDAELAAELRAEMEAALKSVVAILNRAYAQGIHIDLHFHRDQGGRWFAPPLGISKIL